MCKFPTHSMWGARSSLDVCNGCSPVWELHLDQEHLYACDSQIYFGFPVYQALLLLRQRRSLSAITLIMNANKVIFNHILRNVLRLRGPRLSDPDYYGISLLSPYKYFHPFIHYTATLGKKLPHFRQKLQGVSSFFPDSTTGKLRVSWEFSFPPPAHGVILLAHGAVISSGFSPSDLRIELPRLSSSATFGELMQLCTVASYAA